MSKKSKGSEVVLTKGDWDERASTAFELRTEGLTYDVIGERLSVSPWVARELASLGFSTLAAEQADEIRASVEARLDDVLRRLYSDLKVATSQPVRNGIYGLILKNEAQRANLLGLNIPAGLPDALSDGGDRA